MQKSIYRLCKANPLLACISVPYKRTDARRKARDIHSLKAIYTMINSIKVENMNSPKSGYPVANQYLITTYEGGTLVEYFQSYRSVIIKRVYGKNPKTYLDEYYWNYSKTTGKYRNQYLNENTAETRKKIKSGEYILTNLN